MKFITKSYLLALGLVFFFSCEQDINGQQVPGTEALTAEQIAAAPEYIKFQSSMHDYSVAVLTSDFEAFEDRLMELNSQGKLILPLKAEQFLPNS